MSRDKQIEEMARIICGDYNGGVCALDGSACNYNCEWRKIAKHLYNKGYRKSSDVAEEIFAEIESASKYWRGYVSSDVRKTLAELKKKYTKQE